MRKLYFLILLAMIANPLTVLAGSTCKAYVYSAVLRADGKIFKTLPVRDGKNLTYVKDWKGCYDFAVQIAKSNRSETNVTINHTTTVAYTFVKWVYDGWIDTIGELTAHTPKFSKSPKDGSMKYFANGNKWK